jgi:hypothetical protein
LISLLFPGRPPLLLRRIALLLALSVFYQLFATLDGGFSIWGRLVAPTARSGRQARREAHDIGEALQEKLELLPEIERAFVDLYYEFTY